jgi:hypothetical protein
VKCADFLVRSFDHPTDEMARNNVCPSHTIGLIDLARHTGESKYRRLAVDLMNLRDRAGDGTDDNQDRIPFRQQREAVGHAVRANYLYAGAAELCLETGDPTLRTPLEAIWGNLTGRKMAITGACGALFDGASPAGSKEQKTIARTHQAYGRDYELPNATAHNETCAAIGNVMWNWRMLQLTGETKYADVMETALFNAVFAGVSLDGEKYFYTNTLRQLADMPKLRWSRNREAFITCYCCPPNVARTLNGIHQYAYGVSQDGVWCHLYGSSQFDGTLPNGQRMKFTQTANYPWDGSITLTIAEATTAEVTLHLRIPGWAKEAKLSVNGVSQLVKPGTYPAIVRRWAKGDRIELDLPMPVRVVESHPRVEETKNHIAICRGPLVYCLESPDLPEGATVPHVRISDDATWDLGKAMNGVTTIRGKALLESQSAWGNELYRERSARAAKLIDVTLIPYFAWANRGPSEMTVWIPRGR